MRLRNIPGADAAITESVYCIKSPETHKGHWQEIFPSQQRFTLRSVWERAAS